MQADGYSLDDKRTVVSENDIPDIISRFHNLAAEADRERTDKSFFVPVSEIVTNDYDLSINKYKKTVYEAVEYRSAQEIMTNLYELQMQFSEGMEKLKDMLGL
jgi:type I restriction enzyme M protein